MSGVKTEYETGTVIELHIETSEGAYVYVFTDEVAIEDLGIIVHDLAQILLREGEVIVHANFLFQEKSGWSVFGPQGD
jgi:hypothetical protein